MNDLISAIPTFSLLHFPNVWHYWERKDPFYQFYNVCSLLMTLFLALGQEFSEQVNATVICKSRQFQMFQVLPSEVIELA